MKIYRNRMTNKFRVMGKYGSTEYFDTKSEALQDYHRVIDKILSVTIHQVNMLIILMERNILERFVQI